MTLRPGSANGGQNRLSVNLAYSSSTGRMCSDVREDFATAKKATSLPDTHMQSCCPSFSVPNGYDLPQPPPGVEALLLRRQPDYVLLDLLRQLQQLHNLCNPRPGQPILPSNLSPIVNHPGL